MVLEAAERPNEPPAKLLVAAERSPQWLGSELARLSAYDLDPHAAQGATAILYSFLEGDWLEGDTQEGLSEAAAPLLRHALENRDLPDERKYLLGPLYLVCGEEVDNETFAGFFKDFHGAMERAVSEVTRDVTDHPESVSELLANIECLPDRTCEPPEAETLEAATAFAQRLLPDKPGAAAMALGTLAAMGLERQDNGREVEGVIEALAQAACPQAAWALDLLGRWPGAGAGGATARLYARRLVLDGVQPKPPAVGAYVEGAVSEVDDDGSRTLILSFSRPDGTQDVVILLLNDTAGVKDAWCSFQDEGDLSEEFDERMGPLIQAPCSLELARELLADVWAIHQERDEPFPAGMFLCMSYLGSEPIRPRRREPDLSAYAGADMAPSVDVAGNADVLVQHPSISAFRFTSDAAYDYVSEVMPPKARHLRGKKLTEFVRRIVSQEREVFLARAGANLETQALAGRAGNEFNRRAADWLRRCRSGEIVFHEEPAVTELAKESVRMIIDNLRLGYSNQRDANEAAQEFEQQMSDFLESEYDLDSLRALLADDMDDEVEDDFDVEDWPPTPWDN